MRSKNSKWTQVRYWDWKSVISILLIVISFILFFFLRANTSHFALMYSQRNMDGNINGAIIERNALTGMSQAVTGNISKVEGITVTYTYNINSVQYHQKQYLTYSFIDRKKLDYISSSKLPILISIKYDTSHPYISSISLDN